jgi:mycothiol synthase
MVEVRVLPPRAAEEPEIARDLATIAEGRDEHPAFGDAVWRDLEAAPERSRGLIAVDELHIVGYLRAMARPDDDRALDFALVVRPDHRDTDVPLRLLDAAIEYARRADADAVTLWAFGADIDSDALAASVGLEPQRELWQMRVPLPLVGVPRWPERIVVRTFVPGQDDGAWLAVNNAAFAADPDQGGWTPAILTGRLSEPWFDPEDFLIAADADDPRAIAGFCWTKVHPAQPPHEPNALGEIYVIGVDPGHQGLGLGRALVLAGLAHLYDVRHLEVGMLFVDSINTAAVGLYRALGFVTSRIDRCYGRVLP